MSILESEETSDKRIRNVYNIKHVLIAKLHKVRAMNGTEWTIEELGPKGRLIIGAFPNPAAALRALVWLQNMQRCM